MLLSYYNIFNECDKKNNNNTIENYFIPCNTNYEIRDFLAYTTKKPKNKHLININGHYTHSIKFNYNSKKLTNIDFYCQININTSSMKQKISIGYTFEPLYFPKCFPIENKYITVMEIYTIQKHHKYKSIFLTVSSNNIIEHIQLQDLFPPTIKQQNKVIKKVKNIIN